MLRGEFVVSKRGLAWTLVGLALLTLLVIGPGRWAYQRLLLAEQSFVYLASPVPKDAKATPPTYFDCGVGRACTRGDFLDAIIAERMNQLAPQQAAKPAPPAPDAKK